MRSRRTHPRIRGRVPWKTRRKSNGEKLRSTVFNLADVYIAAGAMLLMIAVIRSGRPDEGESEGDG